MMFGQQQSFDSNLTASSSLNLGVSERKAAQKKAEEQDMEEV